MRLAIWTTETLTDLKTDLVVANNNNNKANGQKLKESISTIGWTTSFCGTSVKLYLQVAIEKCTMYVPPKQIRFLGHERKIIMRKRLKL